MTCKIRDAHLELVQMSQVMEHTFNSLSERYSVSASRELCPRLCSKSVRLGQASGLSAALTVLCRGVKVFTVVRPNRERVLVTEVQMIRNR